ncbi:MAG: universal stress protein [Methanolinea sp.]|nr:universal stress protein [Methanolinea sp.]
MFSRILFPTDFSEHAKETLDCIAGFPDVREVILLHVIDTSRPGFAPWGISMMEEEAKRQLQSECTILQSRGVHARAIMRTVSHGPVGEMVIRVAGEENPSMILVGARGKSILRDILLGSVSGYVLRYSPCSVLIMKYRMVEGFRGKTFEKFCPMILSRVLCPTDFSAPAREALGMVSGLCGISEIILLHVVDSGENEEEIAMRKEEALLEMEKDARSLEKKHIPARCLVRIGNPANEIARCAEEEDVSLIGFSSHGRGWLGGFIPGSTAQEVARVASRPVLVIRTPGREKKGPSADLKRSG